jgi:eukaryotic-like serine/threonine-protein kinase
MIMVSGSIGGKYALEREIARGGMGAIWVAFDPQLRRRVALKVMSAEHSTSPSARARFEREALAVAQLQNPHVVQIFDYGLEEGAPYIVMELLEGEDLETRLARVNTLPLAAIHTLITQTAKALDAAHALGIVHRDLKPANIFLAVSGADELVKVLDFGVAAMRPGARGAELHMTRAGSLIGTPSYMSPEQARATAGVDHRADLWSLGVVAYRALTGKVPFPADSLADLLIAICTSQHPPPSSVVPGLGPDVDLFFDRALAKDPARRYQSARDMALAFGALLENEGRTRATKILVVDDEPDVALLVKKRFRQQIRKGVYDFVFASDGEGALDQLRQHPDIDVAVTDINMPGMDGLTFLGRVGEVNPMIKVIIVSAYSDMSNIREAMSRGACDFLVKPIDFKDLEVAIEKMVKRVREIRSAVQSTDENAVLRMFVDSGIVDRLLPMIRRGNVIVGEALNATVAFIDVSGFTAVTRERAPEAAIARLNANFEVIGPEIASRKGTIDKFVGDAVMAVFRGDGHATRALEACVAVRSELRRMASRTGDDSPYTHGVAIGVASGDMVSGGIGSRALSRFDYTVLGDVVNTAARLQAVAERDQILVTASLHGALADAFEYEDMGPHRLAGSSEPTPVFNVLASHAQDLANSPPDVTTVALDETVHSLRRDDSHEPSTSQVTSPATGALIPRSSSAG